MRLRNHGVLLLTLAVIATGCSDSSSQAPADGLRVVATTTILGDVVSRVIGDDAALEVLLPIGVDPHGFQASSRQIADMGRADLVVANGLGLEVGIDDLLSSVEADGTRLLRVAEQLDPIPFGGEASGDLDPHVWMDPGRIATAAVLIASELESIDPEGPWRANAEAFVGELESLDSEIEAMLADVVNRVLVTNHDSLAYFAGRYGFEVVGVVIPGGSTLASPSSAELAELVSIIDSLGVRTIFAETTEAGVLAEAVAAESGAAVVVVQLFVGSLAGPGSGAETYIEMMRTDAALIAGALG